MQTTCFLKVLKAPRHVSIVTPGARNPRWQLIIFIILLPQLGKSKPPPCRRERDKDGAPAGVGMAERIGKPHLSPGIKIGFKRA